MKTHVETQLETQEEIREYKKMMMEVQVILAGRLDDHYRQIKQLQEDQEELRKEMEEIRRGSREADRDSIEYGTPSKTGRVKLYFNIREIEGNAQKKMDAVLERLEYLKKKMEAEEHNKNEG